MCTLTLSSKLVENDKIEVGRDKNRGSGRCVLDCWLFWCHFFDVDGVRNRAKLALGRGRISGQ